MSALVLMLIPVALVAFILVTQPAMGHALLYTGIGHVVIATLVILESSGFFWLRESSR